MPCIKIDKPLVVKLVLEEQSDPALHCLLYVLSLGYSHRLYAYANDLLFLRVFR